MMEACVTQSHFNKQVSASMLACFYNWFVVTLHLQVELVLQTCRWFCQQLGNNLAT